MAASIYDVAKRAGVSISTVSRILNNSANVNEKKAEAVREAMEYYQFVPNQFGRGLAKQQSEMVGVYFPYQPDSMFENAYTLELLKGIEKVLSACGYSMVLIGENLDYKSRKASEPKFLEFIRQKKIDGLILSGVSDEDQLKRIWQCMDEDYPIVYVGRKFHERGMNVYAQLETYMVEMLQVLYEKGHRRILFYTSSLHRIYLDSILKRAKETMGDLNIFPVEGADQDYPREMVLADLKEYVVKKGCTAICTSLMGTAQGILNSCTELKLSVPDQVSILAVEHRLEAGRLFYPQISAFYVPAQDMGQGAAELLVRHMEKRELKETSREYITKFIERESIRAMV